MKTVYFTTQNNGDGSSSVVFFNDQQCITILEDKYPETYGQGEGFQVPDGTEITGIEIRTLQQVQEQLAENA